MKQNGYLLLSDPRTDKLCFEAGFVGVSEGIHDANRLVSCLFLGTAV